jgi:hypothetical protein
MPTPTYTPLANITLTGSASTITFSSISQSYKDLVIVIAAAQITANNGLTVRYEFNSDTNNSNYTKAYMYGDGSSYYSGTQTTASFPNAGFFGYGDPAPLFSIKTDIADYSATDKHKAYVNRVDLSASGNQSNAMVMRWANTSAITSIAIKFSTSVITGSTFALYGIAA